jgi:Cys-tRNA synthase (O-phospho-L-seryl-tRNA:Cys-tRNA synthase)
MYGLYGSTKSGEYQRTIEMLMEKTGKSRKEVAMILYFLHDSQYNNADLKAMADIAIKSK